MADYTHDSNYQIKLEMGSELLRRQFDPTAHDLDSNFRLTRFADLKGRGCKVPQGEFLDVSYDNFFINW